MKQLEITPEIIEKARDIINNKKSGAAGYRIKVFMIPADKYYSTGKDSLIKLEKTPEQLERETRGSDKGIIVSVGKGAWKGDHLMKQGDWAEVGQVVLYQNYEGKTEEEPPGSGNMYRFMNDEGIVGYYKEKCNG